MAFKTEWLHISIPLKFRKESQWCYINQWTARKKPEKTAGDALHIFLAFSRSTGERYVVVGRRPTESCYSWCGFHNSLLGSYLTFLVKF